MKINKKQTIKTRLENNKNATTNNENALAFNFEPKEKLINLCLTRLFGEPKFYNNKNSLTEQEILTTAIKDVAITDPEFVLQTAVYARNVMNLRTTPIAMLVESANMLEFKKTGLIKKYLPQIVKRADELTEVLAYQLTYFNHTKIDENGNTIKVKGIPNQLLRGLKTAFGNFSEYQFAKYNRNGLVTLKDVIKLVHPKPTNEEQTKLYKRILTDSLKIPNTWETTLSSWKEKGFASKKEAWESIINTWTADGKVRNYMAMLRNLNNILIEEVSVKYRNKIAKALTTETAILNSKQLPFRFYSAHKIISKSTKMGAPQMLEAIETAMEISIQNIPQIEGTSFLSSDNSGSMTWSTSVNSKMNYQEIGSLMQALAVKLCENQQTSVFAQLFKIVPASKNSSILDNAKKFKRVEVGGSTNGFLIMEYLLKQKQVVDRIMIFTDCELYDSTNWNSSTTFAELFLKYQSTINKNVKLYMFNLAGYGTAVIPTEIKNAVFISGWSEKVFEFIHLFEQNGITMIDEIKNYEPQLFKGVKQND